MNRTSRSILALLILVSAGVVAGRWQGLVQAQVQTGTESQDSVVATVRARGVIESARSTQLRCELKGVSTILFIVPNGSRVNKGDLLVELDNSSALQEELAAARIQFEQSKARVMQNETELEAAKEDAAVSRKFAENGLKAALLSRERELSDGGTLDYEMTVARSELAVAKASLEAVKKRISQSAEEHRGELLREEVEASEAIKVAQARSLLLEKHERRFKTAMLDLSVAEKELLLTRQKNAAEKAQRLAEAALIASQLAVHQEQLRIEEVTSQMERCRIHAPRDGVALHAAAKASRSDSSTLLEVGAQVRERQSLIQLPEPGELRLRVRVRQALIAGIRVGQSAKIQVDAFPDKEVEGTVIQVSNYSEAARFPNGVQETVVLLSVNGLDDDLPIGLSATAEIDIAEKQTK